MSTGQPKSVAEGDLQLVPVTANSSKAVVGLPPKPPRDGNQSSAIVEYTKPFFKEEEEDLELKLRRILENVPVRVSNTSGSSAGSGSGDFHQYRQMRRREQDRLARIEVDYQKRKEEAEFIIRRQERLKATEERTAKKRLKRQKKKLKKKQKRSQTNTDGEGLQKEAASSDDSLDSNAERNPGGS